MISGTASRAQRGARWANRSSSGVDVWRLDTLERRHRHVLEVRGLSERDTLLIYLVQSFVAFDCAIHPINDVKSGDIVVGCVGEDLKHFARLLKECGCLHSHPAIPDGDKNEE